MLLRILWKRSIQAGQVTLQQNRRRDPIDCSLTFLPADVRRDQEILRGLGRHPLVPVHDGDGQLRCQPRGEIAHRQHRLAFPPVEPERKPQDHLPDLVGGHERGDMGDVAVERPPLEGFQRLGRPPQLVAERHADPLRPVVERQYP